MPEVARPGWCVGRGNRGSDAQMTGKGMGRCRAVDTWLKLLLRYHVLAPLHVVLSRDTRHFRLSVCSLRAATQLAQFDASHCKSIRLLP